MKKLLLIIGLAVVLASGIFFIARPKQNNINSNSGPLNRSIENRITIGGKSLSDLKNDGTADSIAYKPRMNETLASKISMRQISYIKRRGNQDILVFKDNSELYVTNHLKSQLSNEILYRLELGSKRMATSRHGN